VLRLLPGFSNSIAFLAQAHDSYVQIVCDKTGNYPGEPEVRQCTFLEIRHAAAASADQVLVGYEIGIKPRRPACRADPSGKTFTLERFQDPIHRRQRQPRHVRMQSGVDSISRRVAGILSKRFVYGETLRRHSNAAVAANLLETRAPIPDKSWRSFLSLAPSNNSHVQNITITLRSVKCGSRGKRFLRSRRHNGRAMGVDGLRLPTGVRDSPMRTLLSVPPYI